MNDDIRSAATHMLLSRVTDLWIPDRPAEDKTALMNYLIIQINAWLSWKNELPPPADTRSYPTKRPAVLCGGQLDTRIWNAMRDNGWMTIEEMARNDDRRLLWLPNFGRKSLQRLREIMQQEFEREMYRE